MGGPQHSEAVDSTVSLRTVFGMGGPENSQAVDSLSVQSLGWVDLKTVRLWTVSLSVAYSLWDGWTSTQRGGGQSLSVAYSLLNGWTSTQRGGGQYCFSPYSLWDGWT